MPSALKAEAKKSVLIISANNANSLKTAVDNIQHYVKESPEQLDSIAYTLSERREHLRLRGFCVTNGSSLFHAVTQTKAPKQGTGEAVFIFTGQGAQWLSMGRDLVQDYPIFRHSIQEADRVLQTIEHAPTWTIEGILLDCQDATTLANAEYSQPICTALQIALVDLFAACAVVPAAVIGHSSGEIAAAYASGSISLREAVIIAFYRGHVCKSKQTGAMVAVGLGKQDVEPYLVPGVQIACENSNMSITLSGGVNVLEECVAAIRIHHPDALVRRLRVNMAYHSRKSRWLAF